MTGGRKTVRCPSCGAAPGFRCIGIAGQFVSYIHRERVEAARQAAQNRSR